MIINVHAGHNPDGKTACGAVGIVKESTEARAVKNVVIAKLRALGHTVYDCTCEDGKSQSDVLKKIVAKCNTHKADLDVSIHLNSGRNDYVGDGSTGGTEVFCYSTGSKSLPYAAGVARAIAELGYRLRDDSVKDDVKTSTSLYVLKHTNAPAMLIECFFCDDKDDVSLYQRVGGAESIAAAIVKGITGSAVSSAVNAGSSASATAEDALDILKQVSGIKPNPEGHTAEDALDVLKDVVGIGTVPAATVYGTVTGDGVRIRKGPGTNYAVLGSVNKGQRVRIWKEESGWCMIDNGKWVSGKYVQKDS